MSRRDVSGRLSREFTLGGEQAEADPLLQLAFFSSGDYAAVSSRIDPHCFLIGRTGGGKTAVLRRLEDTDADRVIRVNPEDLSLPYITELGAIRFLDSLNVHLDALFIALWKHVLVVELIRHRYKIHSPEEKQNFLAGIGERIRRDPSKRAALDYLEDFQGRFWCETDERVREIMSKFEKQVTAAAGGELRVPGAGRVGASLEEVTQRTTEDKTQETERFQRLVNETQIARLNQMIRVLDEDILDEQHFTYIVVDDLDRDWVDERVANDLVRCLFRAVIDMKRVDNLKIVVALRSNIFDQLHFGSRSSAQEEKFRSLALHMRWTKAELTDMLNERCRIAGEMFNVPGIQSIHDLLPASTRTRDPLAFVLNRTLMRPRDAIAYVNEAVREGTDRKRLTWDHLKAVEARYSHNRLLALRDEWKMTYPGIEKVFQLFDRAELPLERKELTGVLDEAVLLAGDRTFNGTTWMLELGEAAWAGTSGEVDWFDVYQPLVRLLYRVGFLGVGKFKGAQITFAYDDMDFAERASNLEEDALFYVHPAFRATLDIKMK